MLPTPVSDEAPLQPLRRSYPVFSRRGYVVICFICMHGRIQTWAAPSSKSWGWSLLQEAVCRGHGGELSLETLTFGPVFVRKWTKSFQLTPPGILPLDPLEAPPQTTVIGWSAYPLCQILDPPCMHAHVCCMMLAVYRADVIVTTFSASD